MKTIEDLHNLLPIIVKEISSRRHEIDQTNVYTYDKDGWQIKVVYECYGEWTTSYGTWDTPRCDTLEYAHGEVSNITASHTDETSKTIFDDEELDEFWDAINETLEEI